MKVQSNGNTPYGYIPVESHADRRGTLHVAPLPDGFVPKQQFAVTGANGSPRGDHAHREATQVIWVIKGMLRMVSQGKGRCDTTALIPGYAVVIPPRTWVTLCGFSEDCVYQVWSDCEYDESEYIRDPEEFATISGHFPRPVLFAEGQVFLGDASARW